MKNKNKKQKDAFEVFKNYKCDGQYTMRINGDKIEIVEEMAEKCCKQYNKNR